MNCTNCSLPCGHPSSNWWTPAQIKYCWAQIIFLLDGYGSLDVSHWPPQKTGYREQSRQDADVQDMQPASDNRPILEVKAELDRRIEKLPKQLRKVLFDLDWQRDWYNLSPDARDIVNYLKGWRAKEQDFSQWKRSRSHDLKTHAFRGIKK